MEQLTILSYGAGQDSHAIAVKLIEDPAYRQRHAPGRLIVMMADTTNEHPHTLTTIKLAAKYFADNGIEFYLTDESHRAPSWKGGLVYQWKKGLPTIGSKAYPKSCTDKLKIGPIYKCLAELLEAEGWGAAYGKKSLYGFTQAHGKINVLIGFAKSEESRQADPQNNPNKWYRDNITTSYPLIEEGLNRADCQEYLKGMESVTGIPCPMPSNCVYCPFNQEFDLVWLQRNEPAMLQEWMELEADKLRGDREQRMIASDKSLGVWGKPGFTLQDALDKGLKQYGHMSDAELHEYKFSHGHCVSSSY